MVATRFHPGIRADASNAERVYRALADFGAPLGTFQVKAEDFATYSGVLVQKTQCQVETKPLAAAEHDFFDEALVCERSDINSKFDVDSLLSGIVGDIGV